MQALCRDLEAGQLKFLVEMLCDLTPIVLAPCGGESVMAVSLEAPTPFRLPIAWTVMAGLDWCDCDIVASLQAQVPQSLHCC